MRILVIDPHAHDVEVHHCAQLACKNSEKFPRRASRNERLRNAQECFVSFSYCCSLLRLEPCRSLLSDGSNLTTFNTCLDPSERNKLIAISWATNKNTPDMRRRHSSARSNTNPIRRGAESLAHAPNFRLIVVRLVKFGATSPRFKRYWSKHIELVQAALHLWLLNCHFLSRAAIEISEELIRGHLESFGSYGLQTHLFLE